MILSAFLHPALGLACVAEMRDTPGRGDSGVPAIDIYIEAASEMVTEKAVIATLVESASVHISCVSATLP